MQTVTCVQLSEFVASDLMLERRWSSVGDCWTKFPGDNWSPSNKWTDLILARTVERELI